MQCKRIAVTNVVGIVETPQMEAGVFLEWEQLVQQYMVVRMLHHTEVVKAELA
jgi:hypothetical protein